MCVPLLELLCTSGVLNIYQVLNFQLDWKKSLFQIL